MRTAHSPLLGYWTTELGGLNEVVHIWGYESLVQRQKIRNALGRDAKWGSEYMQVMRPMLQAQENIVMVPASDIVESFPITDEVDLPVYELEVCGDDADADTEPTEKDSMFYSSSVNQEQFGGKLVGKWTGVIGNLNGSTINLWRYPTLEAIDNSIRAEQGLFDLQQYNKILLPTEFSPLN